MKAEPLHNRMILKERNEEKGKRREISTVTWKGRRERE